MHELHDVVSEHVQMDPHQHGFHIAVGQCSAMAITDLQQDAIQWIASKSPCYGPVFVYGLRAIQWSDMYYFRDGQHFDSLCKTKCHKHASLAVHAVARIVGMHNVEPATALLECWVSMHLITRTTFVPCKVVACRHAALSA